MNPARPMRNDRPGARMRKAASVAGWCVAAICAVHGAGCAREQDEAELPVGKIEAALDARADILGCRATPLGSAVADAIVAAARRQGLEIDIGFVAADLVGYDRVVRRSGVYPAGVVYRRTVDEMIPYDSPLVLIEMTGAGLRAAFEEAAGWYPRPNPNFLQVSGEGRVRIDAARAPRVVDRDGAVSAEGERITLLSVGGEEIEAHAVYRVVTDIVVEEAWKKRALKVEPHGRVGSVRDALAEYLKDHTLPTEDPAERVVVADAKSGWVSWFLRW